MARLPAAARHGGAGLGAFLGVAIEGIAIGRGRFIVGIHHVRLAHRRRHTAIRGIPVAGDII